MLEKLAPRRPAVRRHRLRKRRALGQLSADLFACRFDQLRGTIVPTLEFGPLSRLIVLSHRVSTPKPRSGDGSQGGLARALAAALRETRGIWFGWSGNKTHEIHGQIQLQRD